MKSITTVQDANIVRVESLKRTYACSHKYRTGTALKSITVHRSDLETKNQKAALQSDECCTLPVLLEGLHVKVATVPVIPVELLVQGVKHLPDLNSACVDIEESRPLQNFNDLENES